MNPVYMITFFDRIGNVKQILLECDRVDRCRMLLNISSSRFLADGCSAHFTGVATGCLGMFAYWFASHPDIMLKDMASSQQVSDETAKNAKAGYIQYLPKDDDILDRVFLVTRWLVVFVLISISFYYLRKWRRKSLSVLRKRRKLSI